MIVNALILATALGLATLVVGAPSNHGQSCGRKKGWCSPGYDCIPKQYWCTDLSRCHGRCVPVAEPLPIITPIPLPPGIFPPFPPLSLPTPVPITPLPEPSDTVPPETLPTFDEPFPWDDLPFPWDPLSTGEPIIDFSPFPFPEEPTPIIEPIPTNDPIIDIFPPDEPVVDPFPFPFPEEPTVIVEPTLPPDPFSTPVEAPRNDYQSCGGFRINPPRCPDDTYCADDPRNPLSCGMACDAPGICIPRSAQICGGRVGLGCPEGLSCYDYPADGCDPRIGGRDCIGICL